MTACPRVRALACATLITASLVLAPLRVSADDTPPVEDGPRRLMSHLECAATIGVLDLTHWTTIVAAVLTCGRAFIDEANWFPGEH